MNARSFVIAAAFVAIGTSAAAWEVPNWSTVVTPPGAIRENRPLPPVCCVVQFGELKGGRFADVTYYGDPASLLRAKPMSR